MIFKYNIALPTLLLSRHIFFTCMMESTMTKVTFMLSKAKQATLLPKEFDNYSYFTYQDLNLDKPIRKNTKYIPRNFNGTKNYKKKKLNIYV